MVLFTRLYKDARSTKHKILQDRTVTWGSQFRWDLARAHSRAEPDYPQHIVRPRRITGGRMSGTLPQYEHTTALLFTYTRWFKYDRDCLHLFTHKSVRSYLKHLVIFPPRSTFQIAGRQPRTPAFDPKASAHGICGGYETNFPPNISICPLFSRHCHPVNVPHPGHLSPTLHNLTNWNSSVKLMNSGFRRV